MSRTIRHANGGINRFEGTACFTRCGPRLLLEEAGRLSVEDQSFEAEQRFLWGEAEGRIDVSFSDNRPFHSIPLGEPTPRTVHLCAPDRYEVAYDFTTWPRWQATWTVEGPRKDYVMVSRYGRAD